MMTEFDETIALKEGRSDQYPPVEPSTQRHPLFYWEQFCRNRPWNSY